MFCSTTRDGFPRFYNSAARVQKVLHHDRRQPAALKPSNMVAAEQCHPYFALLDGERDVEGDMGGPIVGESGDFEQVMLPVPKR